MVAVVNRAPDSTIDTIGGISVTAQIFALCNQKGGVGKSTSTFHLARAAVLRGQRVLVVDNDPQGNLTSVAAAEPVGEDQAGLADVLSARAPETLRDVIVPGIWSGLDVVRRLASRSAGCVTNS